MTYIFDKIPLDPEKRTASDEIRLETQRIFALERLHELRHRKRLGEIHQKWLALQKKCEHPHKSTFSDPTGMTEGHTECADCLKTWRN